MHVFAVVLCVLCILLPDFYPNPTLHIWYPVINMGDSGVEQPSSELDNQEEEDKESGDEDEDHGEDEVQDDNVFSSWPDEETSKLIELFRSREYLYNTAHKYYHRRDKKNAAYSAIAKALGGLPC